MAKLPGPAFWAIVLTAVLLSVATVAGYMHGNTWDTISKMITRSERLQNAFAMFIGMIIMCQGFYVLTMYRRLTETAREQGDEPTYAPALLVSLGYLASLGGSAGFAIVSTDISEDTHTVYATIAFIGLYVYLLSFAATAYYYRANCRVLWPKMAALFLFAPVVAMLVYKATSVSSEYLYAWEFIFAGSMLGASCSLFVPAKALQEQSSSHPQQPGSHWPRLLHRHTLSGVLHTTD